MGTGRPATHLSVHPERRRERKEGRKEGDRETDQGDSPLLLCRSASSRPPLSYKLCPQHWKMTSVTFQSSALNLLFLPTFEWSVVKSSLHLPPTSHRDARNHPPSDTCRRPLSPLSGGATRWVPSSGQTCTSRPLNKQVSAERPPKNGKLELGLHDDNDDC